MAKNKNKFQINSNIRKINNRQSLIFTQLYQIYHYIEKKATLLA